MDTKDTEICFKIAGYYFRYIYINRIIDFNNNQIIKPFLVGNCSSHVICNYIYLIDTKTDDFPKGTVRYKTPAWTWMEADKNIVIFHPNEHEIGYIMFSEGTDIYYTYVTKEDFSPHLLPLSMMGFLLQQVLNRNKTGFIMHGATIDYRGKGLVLTGNSGVGKTTLSQMMIKENECRLLTDDRIIVKEEEAIVAYGNPFDQKIRTSNNESTVIAAIVFLEHGIENTIIRLSEKEAYKRLLTIVLLPYGHKENLIKSLGLVTAIQKKIPIYQFSFTPNQSSAVFLISQLFKEGVLDND